MRRLEVFELHIVVLGGVDVHNAVDHIAAGDGIDGEHGNVDDHFHILVHDVLAIEFLELPWAVQEVEVLAAQGHEFLALVVGEVQVLHVVELGELESAGVGEGSHNGALLRGAVALL